jgi:hypothetical protein
MSDWTVVYVTPKGVLSRLRAEADSLMSLGALLEVRGITATQLLVVEKIPKDDGYATE